MSKKPKWTHKLSHIPLPPAQDDPPNTDDYMVNSAAISDDGSRAIGGTYYYPYTGTKRLHTDGTFGVYCYNAAGHRLWKDEFEGDEGVYAVAISADGSVAAAGGLLTGGRYSTRPDKGMLRAYNAATGHQMLDYADPQFKGRVNAVALSSQGDVLAVATKTTIYLFVRNQQGFPANPSTPFGRTKAVDSVALNPDGTWFAACGDDGNVYAANVAGGNVQQPVMWTEPAHTHFITAAVSAASDMFVVGGGSVVYLFNRNSVGNGPLAQYNIPQGGPKTVRSVSISSDGTLITAVANQGHAGVLVALNFAGGTLTEAWHRATNHNPNSTTMDGAAARFTVADGYPNDKPGSLSLFDANGKLWDHPTPEMSWPMMISANGEAIAAGSDDNTLYYFVP
jgi:WD40 repeat protein